jgi:hypothetical protein
MSSGGNNKQVTVKMGNSYKESFLITDDSILDSFTDEVSASMSLDLDKTLRFIYKGFFVNSQNFHDIEDGATLISVIKKIYVAANAPNAPNTANKNNESGVFGDGINYGICDNNTKPSNQSENIDETKDDPNKKTNITISSETSNYISTEEIFNYKQVRASLIIFLDFVRNNPQIRHMYENDFSQLMYELVSNPTLETIIKNILKQSGQIAQSIDNKENIKVMGFDPMVAVKTYIENNYDIDATVAFLLNLD